MTKKIVTRPTISFVGSGNLTHALAPALSNRGYRIEQIICRNLPRSKARAAEIAGSLGAVVAVLGKAKISSDVIWLCVPDDVISSLAQKLSLQTDWKGKVVLHSSGALSSRELIALSRRGASVASLHPLMSFTYGSLPSLRQVPFAIEGKGKAFEIAARIVRDLGARVVRMPTQSKIFYHAMGLFVAPLVITTLAAAEVLAKRAGVVPARMRRMIAPILTQTIQNFLENGSAAAFSGPLQRGDVSTIQLHLTALKEEPDIYRLYCALAHFAITALPVKHAMQLEELLSLGDKRGPKIPPRDCLPRNRQAKGSIT